MRTSKPGKNVAQFQRLTRFVGYGLVVAAGYLWLAGSYGRLPAVLALAGGVWQLAALAPILLTNLAHRRGTAPRQKSADKNESLF